MPVARPESGETRVIAHLDLDCFYVQVEQRKRPDLRGKPVAVVQYNPWKGGGLIAVSYEARSCGVTRSMRGDDAKKVCPDIELVQVPMAHGHAFLRPYRDAGSEVVTILSRGGVCERASIDEVYLDITDAAASRLLKDPPLVVELTEEARKTHILGLAQDGEEAMTTGQWICQTDSPRSDALLACGAVIVAELRTAVLIETQFTCSAGIAHNKMLAKLTSSMHKPAQQTVIPSSYVPTLLASLPLKKIGQLGGKLGKSLQEDLGVKTPSDLLPFSEMRLQELYGVNTGTWLWNIARGKSGDEVKGRVLPKSHSCGKSFSGPQALKNMTSVVHWLGEMCGELQERLDLDLELNNRTARLLIFHAAVHLRGGSQATGKFPSRSCPLRYGREKILADALVLFERGLRDFCPSNQSISPVKGNGGNSCNWAVTALSVGASGISAVPTGVNPITSFFTAPAKSNSLEPKRSSYPSSPPPSPSSPSSSSVRETRSGKSNLETQQSGEQIETGSSSRTPLTDWLCGSRSTSILYDEQKDTDIDCHPLVDSSDCRSTYTTIEDDMTSDVDIEPWTCTPKFGIIGSPVHHKSQFQVLGGATHGDSNQSFVQERSGAIVGASESTFIQCSPVENVSSSIPVDTTIEQTDTQGIGVGEAPGGPVKKTEREKLGDGILEPVNVGIQGSGTIDDISSTQMELKTDEGEAERKATQIIQRQLAFPPSTSGTETQKSPSTSGINNVLGAAPKVTTAPKLKDFWQRNLASSTQNTSKRTPSNWEYKEDEIDEEVLLQLPAEIQKELRDSLKLNRPLRPTKRPTISDFFPSSSK